MGNCQIPRRVGFLDFRGKGGMEGGEREEPGETQKEKMNSPKKKKKACKECTRKCLRTHAKSSTALPSAASSVATVPSFFKIMIGDFSKALYIPPMFARTIGDLVDKNVYLEDAYGYSWRVKTCLIDGSLAFGFGWYIFVLDHGIRTGEFVVFKHIKRLVFSVQIFAASACERLHLCEKNERSRKRKRHKKMKKSNELSSGKIHDSLDASEEKLHIAAKIPLKTEKLASMINPDISRVKMAVGNCCDRDAGNDLAQSNSPPCPANSSEKLGIATMISFFNDFPKIVDEDTIELEMFGEFPERNFDVDMNKVVMTQKVLEEKEVRCDCSSQNTEMIVMNDKMSHSHCANPRESQTALAVECAETTSNKQSQSSLAVFTYSCANECLPMDYFKGDVVERFIKQDMRERSGSCRPQTSEVTCPENDTGNLASLRRSAHKSPTQEMKFCEDAKQDNDKLGISINPVSFNVNGKGETISPDGIFRKNYALYENKVEAPSSARALECSNDGKEILVPSCDDTQFGIKSVENQASGNAPLVSFRKVQSCSVASGESNPKMTSNMSKLHDRPDIMEQKDRVSGTFLAAVKTERMDPIDIQSSNHGKFSFSSAVTVQSWLEFHERLSFRLGKIKHGRKVIILRDPCMRIWPVLYHESAWFVGFISGWEEFSKANDLRKGHICEFELYSSSGPTLQLRVSK